MFGSIMVPVDGSSRGEEAIHLAAAVARLVDAHVHLVHVRTAASALVDEGADPADDYLRALGNDLVATGLRVSRAVLQDELSTLLPSRRPTRATAHVLRQYITEHGISLVVMASHGRGGLRRAWLGSVADALLREAEAPLLITRARRRNAPRETTIRTILLPLDGSELSEQAIEPALALARAAGARIVLVRCVEPIREPANPKIRFVLPPTTEIMEQETAEAGDYLRSMVARLRAQNVDVECQVIVAPAPAGILSAARRREVDLIAMATSGAGGAERFVIGSVADKVIRAATIPVLAMRAGDTDGA